MSFISGPLIDVIDIDFMDLSVVTWIEAIRHTENDELSTVEVDQ